MERRKNRYAEKRIERLNGMIAKMQSGAVVSRYGQWEYPGMTTVVPSSNITMKGVPYPVLGVSNTGDTKMMLPDMDYQFNGNSVTEYPLKSQTGNNMPFLNIQGSYDVAGTYSGNPTKTETNRKFDPYQIAARNILFHNLENTPLPWRGFNIFTNNWTPIASHEKDGTQTLAHGLKIVPENYDTNWYKTYKKNGHLTNEQAIEGVYEMTKRMEPLARDVYQKSVGDDAAWNKLDDRIKALMIDYYYTGVLNKFPKFMDSIYNNDRNGIFNEYKRYSNGELLTKRNKNALRILEEVYGKEQNGGNIHIKESNRGKFTEAAERAGKSVQAYAAQILANKDNYPPALVKRANFARNSAKWKHQEGGNIIGKFLEGNYINPDTVAEYQNRYNNAVAEGLSKGEAVADAVGAGLNAAIAAGGAAFTQYGKDNSLRLSRNTTSVQEMKNSNLIAPVFSKPELQDNRNIEEDLGFSPVNPDLKVDTSGYNNWRQEQYKNTLNEFQPKNKYDVLNYKYATGANANNLAQIEQGEVVSTPTGNSIANLLAVYHQLFPDIIEKNGTNVKLTNDMFKDITKNPTLSPISKRVNKYTAARRKGRTFIFPSTIGMDGEILEPKQGQYYPLAQDINLQEHLV